MRKKDGGGGREEEEPLQELGGTTGATGGSLNPGLGSESSVTQKAANEAPGPVIRVNELHGPQFPSHTTALQGSPSRKPQASLLTPQPLSAASQGTKREEAVCPGRCAPTGTQTRHPPHHIRSCQKSRKQPEDSGPI